MQDKNIVDLYWERNEEAITHTDIKYGKYLWKIAHNILSDVEDSKECVNDTYLAAWNSIPPHRPTILSTYLGKITRRISINVFHKRNRVKRCVSEYAISLDEVGDCIPHRESPESACEEKLLGEAINRFLYTQSEEARTLFIGRYYFFDSLKDAASYSGMSESKAKSMLFRMRCALKVYLEQEGFYI